MAFEPIPLKIVPKGLDLVPPGDQVAEGDCLDLTGWWPGSTGRLQQARGWVKKNTGGGNLNSLAESDGQLFFSDGSTLYQGTENGAAATAIDTGYDGKALGLCGYQHVMWVMNRSKQRRVGTGPNTPVPLSNWGNAIATPTAPSGVISGGGGLADGQHSWFVTFVDEYGYETNPSPAFEVTTPSLATPFNDGTVHLIQNSTAVVLTPSLTSGWGPQIDGQQFLVPYDYPTITPPSPSGYTITYVDATHGTISPAWFGATHAAIAYEIYSAKNVAKAAITRPSTADPTVTGWNVYHQSPGTDGPYQCNLLGALGYLAAGSDPKQLSATVYMDYGDAAHGQDDTSLLDADMLMEADHDPPPACSVMAAAPYNGRIVVANSAAYPNRIWYTNALEPNYFPGSGNPQSGNWVDIGNDSGDAILNLSVRPGMLLVYRQKSIWRVIGDLGDPTSTIGPLIPNMGIVGPRAVVGTSNGDIAVVKQGQAYGLYRVTDWEQRISGKVEPIFNGIGAECYPAMNAAAASTCALGYQLGRLWFAYPDGSNTYPNRVLICDVEQDSFSFSVAGRWFSRYGVFGAFLHGSLFFLGAGSGKVYSLEDGSGDEDGSNTSLAFQSAYLDGGSPDHEKTFGDLVISHNTLGATLTVTIKVNKGADSFVLTTISSASLTRQEIPMLYPAGHANAGQPIEGFNLAVRIAGNGPIAFPGAIIDSPIIVHAFLKPRKAMTWDSGPTDHGSTGAKVVDAVEVDMDGGAAKLFIQTDVPGGVLIERTAGGTGIVVPATSGRQTQRIVLPAPINGRLLRYQVYASGSTPILVYKVRPRILPVGVFADGTMGDSWYTEPIAAGVE